MGIDRIGSTFNDKKSMLSKHETQMCNLDIALTKMDVPSINKIKKEAKASQQVYKPFHEKQYNRKPLTRLEKNMLLFKEIFIIPEEERIHELKEKEKEFTDLVLNKVNEQYDKL